VRPEDQINNAPQELGGDAARVTGCPGESIRQLALALRSCVFDREFKPEWNGETLSLSAALRFNAFKLWDERGDLATNLKKMDARDLTWVVNAPVPDSEIEWARKNCERSSNATGAAHTAWFLTTWKKPSRKAEEAVRFIHV
jgi:hypothetical protein